MEEENYGEIFRKLESGEEMDEWERKILVSMAYGEHFTDEQKDMQYVTEFDGDDHRWHREHTVVFRYKGLLYALCYWAGLTERQEPEYPNQPYKAREVERARTVKEYLPLAEADAESNETTALSPIVWVEQSLILRERLAPMKQYWEAKLEEIKALAPTEENLAAIRAFRADARKDIAASKDIMNAAIKPAVDAVANVKAAFAEYAGNIQKEIDDTAKAKESEITDAIIAPCREAVESYYWELCEAYNIDFIPFDAALQRTGTKIGLTEARQKSQPPKKIADKLSAFLTRIRRDVDAIFDMENYAEIMWQYHTTLDLAGAIQTVSERHKGIEAEQAAAEQREEQNTLEAAAVAAVEEAVAEFGPPTISVPVEEDVVYPEVTLRLKNVSKAQLLRLKDFLNEEGIVYA